MMIVLGIETTCDETACAIVKDGKEILSNIVFSQASIHEKYHGVFPEVASRTHAEKIPHVYQQTLKEAHLSCRDIDVIAVAQGPGLLGSLLVGIHFAKALALATDKPIVGINHVEAHLYAAMMGQEKILLPALGVILSGGHMQILYIKELGHYKMIGTTIDDAIGESFDKVATLLDLPYPGGPWIEKIAKEGNAKKYPFKAGEVKTNKYDFSLSGLKTNVLYTVKGPLGKKDSELVIDEKEKKDIAASFQQAVCEDVVKKTLQAAYEYNVQAVYFGGGVTQNKTLRNYFESANKNLLFFWPPAGLSIDNAVMIAGLGYHKYFHMKKSFLEPFTRMSLEHTIPSCI